MIILLFYYLTSHLISFTCSILEAVLLCCTNGYIGLLKKKKPKAGHILADLKTRIDRPLAAILTLNTAAHTFGAAGVGAQVVELFGNQWLAMASVILTLTMLFLTEMIPKTIGALYWKKLAPFTAYFIRFLIWITYPFVVSFEYIARLLSRGKTQEKITEEEIKLILEEGTQAGVIKEVEHDMVESIFRLGNRRVGILMIPRMNIEWLDLNKSIENLRKQVDASPHNRFPVCDGELDEVIGLVTSKDILNEVLAKGTFDLKTLVKPPLFVPENMRVVQLLDLFKKTPDHLALVTDEYGGVQGLITLHDVLESIVGDVPTTSILPEMSIIQRKDGSWLVDGMLPIDELKEQFDLDQLPEEEKGTYRTLGGFCMRQIGSIPNVGDSFTWQKFKFKVVKMQGRRVEKVLINYIS
ncbi:hemolysin family protein [Candidatus Protochlamydia phocaeensis]|uniref:hemolysin family protein n=1 Tax=Candidatus Protochlamydia phocaeensis TaxID=1414722 RepID=UPI0008393D48|nr:hemolysin family protein [Candidatus Protochlamydia phocaeensis]